MKSRKGAGLRQQSGWVGNLNCEVQNAVVDAEDVANGVQTKSHPMNAAQWDHFRFWLAVFRRIKETAM